jgi:thiosulfate reductase cytochrome b subunit
MGILTDNIKHYVIKFGGIIGRIWKQVLYYIYGILKGAPHPFAVTAENKFNPIQQVSYIGVMFALVPLILISGVLALYAQSAWALVVHSALGILGLIFIFVHVYMCTTGDKPSYLIKVMFDGYHREDAH